MSTDHVLLMTDVVDSTQLSERLGDDAAAALWQAHDQITRSLLRLWRGREIDKSDGFLLLFDSVADALGCALATHQALAALTPPLAARAGIHVGALRLRPNSAADIRQGAKPLEVDGIAKPLAARIMGLARGGQTVLSEAAHAALAPGVWQLASHGHWRLKGLPEPLELFGAAEIGAPLLPPEDSAKAYRVILTSGGWAPLRMVPHSLPAERDGFIGRDEPLAVLAQRFHHGARLVSVLGIGGVGKTRLALRFARHWLGDYPGGAWFCDLSSARGLDGLLKATAQGLGLPLGKVDPVARIGEAIAARGACLVILDNFEQVACHAEATVGRWLAAAQEATLLITSREVLGIIGEEAVALAPLGSAEAARLFELRAMAADSGYQPGTADVAAVPALMDLLDRLPLAIELAAARVRVMAPATLLARMDHRFRLLGAQNGRRDRQATLRATLDWSWDLLSLAEQAALAQLSVFENGFALASAEAVIDLSAFASGPWVADTVQHLVEKSLLRRSPDGRFDLLRSVFDYARERLAASGTLAAAERRHWRHFACFDDAKATADRCVELDNLVAACRRAALDEPAQAVNALVAAWSALRLTGPFRAVINLAEPLVARTDLPSQQQLRLHGVLSSALRHLGDMAGADHHLLAGQAAAEHCPEALEDRAQLLVWRSEFEIQRGQLGNAAAALEDAAALAETCGSPQLRLRVLNEAGNLGLAQGQLDVAIIAYAKALSISQALGNLRWEGGCEGNLGVVRHVQGRLPEARAHYQRAVDLAVQVGDRAFEGNSRCNLGLLLHEQGDDTAAREALACAVQVARQIGHPRLECTSRCNLGIVNESLGDIAAALADYQLAIAQAAAIGDARNEGQFLGYRALLLARRNNGIESARDFERAEALITPLADPALHALLYAQRALACRLLGNTVEADQLVERAETSALGLELGPDSEVRRLLAQAQQTLPPEPAQTTLTPN